MSEGPQTPAKAAPSQKGGSGGFLGLLVVLAAAYGYLHFVAHAAVHVGKYVIR